MRRSMRCADDQSVRPSEEVHDEKRDVVAGHDARPDGAQNFDNIARVKRWALRLAPRRFSASDM